MKLPIVSTGLRESVYTSISSCQQNFFNVGHLYPVLAIYPHLSALKVGGADRYNVASYVGITCVKFGHHGTV